MKRLVFLCVMMFVLGGLAGGYVAREVFFLSPDPKVTPVVFVVEPGSSVSVIADQLHEASIIKHPTLFAWVARWSKKEAAFHHGTFAVTPGAPLMSLVEVLTSVATAAEVQVTVPEGFTNDQIEERLSAAIDGFDRAAWKEQTKDLQGYLFPDTYRFSSSVTVNEVVTKMRATLDRRLLEKGIVVNEARLHELLTLASIIEREVITPEDMRHAAGVFTNRLRVGMPLQSDAAMETYKERGLPDEPICNPGINAIFAAANPDITDDFYFISFPGHAAVFAKTLDEHNWNVWKYLKNQ